MWLGIPKCARQEGPDSRVVLLAVVVAGGVVLLGDVVLFFGRVGLSFAGVRLGSGA